MQYSCRYSNFRLIQLLRNNIDLYQGEKCKDVQTRLRMFYRLGVSRPSGLCIDRAKPAQSRQSAQAKTAPEGAAFDYLLDCY